MPWCGGINAQSCYDHITHSMAALCCQRWGVPHRIMETMLGTIQGMKFYLRTGYGDSTRFYGGGQHLFQGICQGNRAGPAVWLAISTVLVLLLREKSCRSSIRGPSLLPVLSSWPSYSWTIPTFVLLVISQTLTLRLCFKNFKP